MIFLIDFDGTITTEDVTDKLLSLFADKHYLKIEQDWLEGKISSRECMSRQYELIHADHEKIIDVLENISIDPSFIEFCNATKTNNKLYILSDGIDYPIRFFLKKYNLEFIDFYSNKLIFKQNRPSLSFPYYSPSCKELSGLCKCQQMKNICNVHSELTVLIGNGKSDTCLSHQVDMVFAKEGLLNYCQKHNISYYPYMSFNDVLHYFQTI